MIDFLVSIKNGIVNFFINIGRSIANLFKAQTKDTESPKKKETKDKSTEDKVEKDFPVTKHEQTSVDFSSISELGREIDELCNDPWANRNDSSWPDLNSPGVFLPDEEPDINWDDILIPKGAVNVEKGKFTGNPHAEKLMRNLAVSFRELVTMLPDIAFTVVGRDMYVYKTQ